MTNSYRYTLASNKFPKLKCPYCGAIKHWQRYFDNETGEVLPDKYGRCDNSTKCGKGLNPYTDGYNKMEWEQEHEQGLKVYKSTKELFKSKPFLLPNSVFIPHEVFKQTLRGYEQNQFLQNMLYKVDFPFEASDLEKIISLYYLGTVRKGYRSGATTFPYIDIWGRVRAIQVKQFDKTNHTVSTDFIHSIIEKYHTKRSEPLPFWLEEYKKQAKYVSCLFGEHLLYRYPLAPIALVEAPKTAVCCTLYYGLPDEAENLIWLAVYNKNSFTLDKLSVLQGRDVYVFPDLSKDGSTFQEWQQKARNVEKQLPGTKFIFYNLLEQCAPYELKEMGADIADVLIKLDWRKFRKQKSQDEPLFRSRDGPVSLEMLIREKCENCETREKTYYSQQDTLLENMGKTESCDLDKDSLLLEDNTDDMNIHFDKTIQSDKENAPDVRHQTFGELFDLLKDFENSSLLKRLEIHIP